MPGKTGTSRGPQGSGGGEVSLPFWSGGWMDRCPRRQAGREQLGPKGEQTRLPRLPGQSSRVKRPRQPQCQAEQHPKHKAGSKVAAIPGE